MKFRSTLAVLFVLVSYSTSYGAPVDGAKLYDKYCSKCHLSLEKSERAGRRAKRIRSAINANIGGMGQLKFLKKEEIEAIAAALAKVKVK